MNQNILLEIDIYIHMNHNILLEIDNSKIIFLLQFFPSFYEKLLLDFEIRNIYSTLFNYLKRGKSKSDINAVFSIFIKYCENFNWINI